MLRGRVSLRATVHSSTRVVAATFMLDGVPLGTVTKPPWTLDVDAPLLSPGAASLSVAVVDRLGRRATSAVTEVRVLRGAERILAASTNRHLSSALRALARGFVTVHLAPGRYRVAPVALGPGARLSGSGPATVLSPRDGQSATSLLSTRDSGVRISDLAVDGAGQVDQAISVGDGATDVRLQRLDVSGVRVNGIDVWGIHSAVSVQDCRLRGSGSATTAGVLDLGSNQSSQVSVVRTHVSGFRGYGVLFAQRFHGLRRGALHNLALDDRISDIYDPTRQDGTDEGGIWTGGVQAAVIGNAISGTGIDGIETVGSSTDDTIIANDVRHTPVAIYVEHSTNNSLVAANHLANVGTGINVEWRHAGGGSNSNVFTNNRIDAGEAGVFVDVQDDYNAITQNTFQGGRATPIVLQGSSHNVVRGNVACGALSQTFIVQQSARSEDGAFARAIHNQLVDNERTGPCTEG